MIDLKSIDLVPLTKELAVKFATMPGVPGERELKRERVAHFAALAREGTPFQLMWTTAIAKDTGEEYRFDGHHASYALSRLTEEEFPANWKVALRVFEIDSLAEDAVELLLRQPGGRKVAERHQAEGDRRRSGARSSRPREMPGVQRISRDH
ncbi:MAG: hypothetical protein WA354_23520 [Terracidiphilus sp.]